MSPSRLKYVDPSVQRGRAYRALAWFSASRFGLWLSRNIGWRLDPHLLRLTRGRLSSGGIIATGLLETRGARTGLARRNAVIYFHDEERVTIVASKAGAAEHPAWFYNLRSNPEVRFGDAPCRAEIVETEEERDRLWRLADRVFPPFARYREQAARSGRTIPIVQLIPR